VWRIGFRKVMEDANVKLASVATDPLGASSRAKLKAIIASEHDVEKPVEMARELLRRKTPQLQLGEQRNDPTHSHADFRTLSAPAVLHKV
jgi:hypothetical protein